MLKMNLKSAACGFCALALTMVLSWTFVDATSLSRMQSHSGPSAVLVAISALVR